LVVRHFPGKDKCHVTPAKQLLHTLTKSLSCSSLLDFAVAGHSLFGVKHIAPTIISPVAECLSRHLYHCTKIGRKAYDVIDTDVCEEEISQMLAFLEEAVDFRKALLLK